MILIDGVCTCPEDKGYVLRNGYCEPNVPIAPPAPGCEKDDDCPNDKYCAPADRTCRDPCPGACGLNTNCLALNHVAVCYCREGFIPIQEDPRNGCYGNF